MTPACWTSSGLRIESASVADHDVARADGHLSIIHDPCARSEIGSFARSARRVRHDLPHHPSCITTLTAWHDPHPRTPSSGSLPRGGGPLARQRAPRTARAERVSTVRALPPPSSSRRCFAMARPSGARRGDVRGSARGRGPPSRGAGASAAIEARPRLIRRTARPRSPPAAGPAADPRRRLPTARRRLAASRRGRSSRRHTRMGDSRPDRP